VAKYHVGDRWADQDGDEWFVYRVSTENVYAVDSGGVTVVFTYVRSMSGLVLTRLISSERWIPFAEHGPDEPEPNERRSILIRDPLLHHVEGRERICIPHDDNDSGRVRWFESHLDSTIDEMIDDGYSEWRYLLPPEAS
jgi:hypothetical protein